MMIGGSQGERQFLMSEVPLYPLGGGGVDPKQVRTYRGTSLIRKRTPLRTIVGP
jgi:hypothetical protein